VSYAETLEDRARTVATLAHAGVMRKWANEPYVNHPARVAAMVKSVPHTGAMVAAAWLHDVVEDTNINEQQIRAVFGSEVTELVMWLTDVSLPEDGNRAKRKAIDREHLSRAPREAKTIKLADLIDNTRDIAQHDPKFAKIYLAEKRLLLEAFRGDCDPTLWDMADHFLKEHGA
jgi:(p)ppGpp synthase/HD superfamily hydrolase